MSPNPLTSPAPEEQPVVQPAAAPPRGPIVAWDAQPSLTLDQLRNASIALNAWYWVEHSTPGFNGRIGVLEFLNGKAVYAPEKIVEDAATPGHADGATDWFAPVGDGTVTAQRTVPLWVLLWCWKQNGFTVRAMQGGRDEWEDFTEE